MRRRAIRHTNGKEGPEHATAVHGKSRHEVEQCEHEIDEEEILLLEELAEDLSFAMAKIKAEEALQESEEKFRNLFDLSPQAVALTEVTTGKLIDVNNMFCKLTKYSKKEVVGKTTMEVGFYSEDDRARFIKELKTLT